MPVANQVVARMKATVDSAIGRGIIRFPAGTSVEQALDAVLYRKPGIAKRPTKAEIRRRGAQPIKLAGVDFPNAKAAYKAIKAFSDRYKEHRFRNDEEVQEVFADMARPFAKQA
jgi:hypothetical protein